MLTFDDVGYRYDLPVYVINEASRYGVEKSLPKIPNNFKGNDINLAVRCVKFKDTELIINTCESILELKEKFKEKNSLGNEKVRLFFNGKELKNEMIMHHCKIYDGVVIQAHVQ